MMMNRFLVGGGAVVVVGGLIAYAMGAAHADAGLLNPDDGPTVRLGEEVYAAQCATCHGANLEGHPNWKERDPDGLLRAPPHDATGHTWHHKGEMLFQLTKYGPGKILGDPNYATAMPAYENVLSDAEIIAVLSYIKSTWPRQIRERHDEMEKR